jgi:hypothetical protein
VPIGGEAFAALTVLFVLGMLLIVLWRAFAKTRATRRGARRRSHDGGGDLHTGDGGARRSDAESDSGGDGGGDGGGGGD